MRITQKLTMSVCTATLVAIAGVARADLGGNNPTGVSGEFNGNVTTGCSYDPYTGNATRTITDIVVPGAVGMYPLAFTRSINSRISYGGSLYNVPFGRAGGWRHCYQWGVEPITISCAPNATLHQYIVDYPDGRQVFFDAQGIPTTPGIGDRFLPVTFNSQTEETDAYLLLTDGGRVHFAVSIYRNCDDGGSDIQFVFNLAGIIDPYNQETTIAWGYPTPTLATFVVTEPAGRNLSICWKQLQQLNGVWVIDRVEERPGPNVQTPSRTVQYNYATLNGEPALDNVVYFGDLSLTAHYTYQNSNAGTGHPKLIKTCNDTMFSGPMGKIAYDFASGKPHGFLWRERYFDGINGDNGPAVSILQPPDDGDDTTRTETRGDGPSRTFTYSNGLLDSWTDFMGNQLSQERYTTAPIGFVSHVTTLAGRTDYARNAVGNITQITYPLTPSDSSPAAQSIGYSLDDPYRLISRTDEKQHQTLYLRNDPVLHVTYIYYPDNSSEEFHYDDRYGQLLRHRRKNGYYEHFQYDSRGRLEHAWNPVASPNQPTGNEPNTAYTYYSYPHPWQDRVHSIKDPRGFYTFYEYEVSSGGEPIAGRGLVSKVTHTDYSYITFGYDARGNNVWEENELRHRKTSYYDDYNRVYAVYTPLPNNGTAATFFDYTPFDSLDRPSTIYKSTTRNVTSEQTATGVRTEKRYNANGVLTRVTYGVGTSEAATTLYSYDYVGHRLTVTDPRGGLTNIDYDARSRRAKLTTPELINSNNLQYVTQWFYDPVGNIRDVLKPDGNKIHREYDQLNRLLTNDMTDQYMQEHRVTQYTYWPSGQIHTIQDPKLHVTTFEYDERDLKSKMVYPPNPGQTTTLEGWIYDANGNMTQRPTIGGPLQWLSYDGRNRLKNMSWSTGIDWSNFDYDYAGRLTSAVNPYSAVSKHYDDGGRMDWERQVLTAGQNNALITISPTRVVSRKNHGPAGTFDIDLPLTETPGTECRMGPDYTLVLTFANPVTVGGAMVISGIGTVVGVSAAGNDVEVHLNNVSDAQVIGVRIFGLNDGVDTGEITVPIHVLIGDSVGHGVVNLDDKSETANRSGQEVDSTNFRSDTNTDGFVNNEDLVMVTASATSITPVAVDTQDPAGVTVLYDYYQDGEVKTLSVAKAGYGYGYDYDGRGRLHTIRETSNPLHSVEYTYDDSSNVTQRATHTDNWGGDMALNFDHDELNRVTEETIATLSSGVLSHLHHGYNAVNQLRQTLRDEDGLLDSFGYSFTGELNNAQFGLHRIGTSNDFDSPNSYVAYAYDNAGNRQLFDQVNYVTNSFNEYTQVGSAPVGNNNQHQIESYQGIHYTYLGDTRLSKVTSEGGDQYELSYDALGRTVRRTMNGQRSFHFYAGGNAILEYNGSGGLTGATLYGSGMDEVVWHDNNGVRQFPLPDRMGSIVAVANASGKLIEQYRYDAFGTPTIMDPNGDPLPNNESAINNRFLFAGREWVSRFRFYENRARAYHPGLGRFMSEDSLGFASGENNLFRYCGNDPFNWVDPSGLQGEFPLFNPPPDYINGLIAQHYLETYGPQGQVMGAYNGVYVPIYNAALSLLSSAEFKFVIGGVEVGFGFAEGYTAYKEGAPLSDQTLQGVSDGFEDMWDAGVNGHGIDIHLDQAKRMYYDEDGQIHFDYVEISGGRPFDYVGYSFATALNGALNSFLSAAQTYGPGIGVITVTDSSGTRVIWAGTFGGPYGGFAPGSPGYYNYMGSLNAAAQLYLAFGVGGGQPGEGFHPVPYHLE